MIDTHLTLGIVLLAGAIGLVAWGIGGVIRYRQENGMRESKEPSTVQEKTNTS